MTSSQPAAGEGAEAASRRPFSIGGPIARYEWLTLGAVVLVYLAVVALAVRRGPALGWDESVYALRGRDFVTGAEPGRYWNAFRAPGLPWLGHLVWVEGREATVLRLLVSGFGLGLVATTWLLTRHLFGRRAGLIAAAGVAVTPPLLLAATQVWPDVPGACLGLVAITLFVLATGGERSSWWMLAVVPAVAAATYLRFGAPLPVAIGLLGVAWWRRRMLLRHPLPAVLTVLAASAAVVLVLEVPFLTGAETAPLGSIGGMSRGYFEGFADYAALAQQVIGPAAVVLALAGFVAAFGWAGRGIDRGALLAAVLIGLATAAAIAFVLHGEVRYLAPAYPWLWVAGAPGLERVGGLLPGRARPLAAAVVAAALVAAVVGTARDRNRDASAEYTTVRRAAEAVAERAEGRPCVVVTSRVPQVMWYSGCQATLFHLGGVSFPAAPGRMVFMLLVGGFGDQPQGELLEAYRAAAGEPVLVLEGRRAAEIYLVRGPAGGG